ncbi:hypothetical protein C0993_006349, partial [Termitomyces sp. T159_Od127]
AICPICSELFDNQRRLYSHIPTHNDKTTIAFNVLGRVFILNMDTYDYMFSCPLSGCNFKGEVRDLYMHFETVHYKKLDAPLDPLPSGNSRTYLDQLPIHCRNSGSLLSSSSPPAPDSIALLTPSSTSGKKDPAFALTSNMKSGFTSTVHSPSLSSGSKKRRLDSDLFQQDFAAVKTGIFNPSSPTLLRLSASSSTKSRSDSPFPPSPTPTPHSPISIPLVISLAVLGEHSDYKEFFKFLVPRVTLMENTCVAHMLLQIPSVDSHFELIKCSIPVKTGAGHYELEFRRGLTTTANIRACYSCWCPQPLAQFKHDKNVGRMCTNEWHQDFWRGVAYIVWRCDALFHLITDYLHIDPHDLTDLVNYKRWLLMRGPFPNNMYVSNLVMIVYAYIRLRELDLLPKGELLLRDVE